MKTTDLLPKVGSPNGCGDFVGVDPGAKGGVAILRIGPHGYSLQLYRMPVRKDGSVNGKDLSNLLYDVCAPVTRALVEQVSSAPRQAHQFQFGLNTGVVHGVLGAHDMPFALIHSVQWKGLLGLSAPGLDTKEKKRRSIELACELFDQRYHKDLRASDGMAEAALLAYVNAYRLTAVKTLTHYGDFYA